MKKWNRSLGTSKREQGVETPPAPQHPKRRREFYARMATKDRYESIWYVKIWRWIVHFWKDEDNNYIGFHV